jgi:hypothetical protein
MVFGRGIRRRSAGNLDSVRGQGKERVVEWLSGRVSGGRVIVVQSRVFGSRLCSLNQESCAMGSAAEMKIAGVRPANCQDD